jgi:Cd2+/Zn2+-exporting ATPase
MNHTQHEHAPMSTGNGHGNSHAHGNGPEHDGCRSPAPAHDQLLQHETAHTDDTRGAMPGLASACCSPPADPQAAASSTAFAADASHTAIRILQMDCPTEETLIRNKLQDMPAVLGMEFNLMQRVLTVAHTADAREPIFAAIRTLGFEPEQVHAGKPSTAPAQPHRPWWPLGLAGLAALASETAHWTGGPEWLAATLAVAAIASCGLGTYKKGFIALRNGNLNINALMSIAVTGALVLQQWPEAAMVMVLFTIAELIESRSLDRARNAIQGLMQLAPEKATVQQADGSWSEQPANTVALDALVRTRPGERIGLDGTIMRGGSSVNQAPITGESLPVDKSVGDPVFAGTINGAGSFDYRVGATAGHSTLARIIHAVEQAQGSKAPTQRFVDRFARIYTPVVFAMALAVAIVPPLLFGGLWIDWVYKALVLLVIACPCALVISTPVTIVSGLAAAARKGILIKGGAFLEQGRKLDWLALDKTGTLTHGTPVQTGHELPPGADLPHGLAHYRRLAISLAARSDHPVSLAIANAPGAQGINALPVTDFQAVPGQGVRGTIDGQALRLGNHHMVHAMGRCSSALEARLDHLERQGKTVVMLVDDTQVLALFIVADTVKDSSRAAIAELHALGIRTLMLTGDNPHTAQAIGDQVGIAEVRGNQLPQDKLAAVAELTDRGNVVGMVGDGINDAPALARADIGFAMGALGTDTAIETADVALMDDDLHKLAAFVRLSHATHRVLVQNIVLAIGIKVAFLALAIGGLGTMWMAVFADVGASLLVVGNGLRILRK